MFQKESFIKNLNTNYDNWWWDQRRKTTMCINRETAKISALLSGKIYKYRFVTVEEIIHSDQI